MKRELKHEGKGEMHVLSTKSELILQQIGVCPP